MTKLRSPNHSHNIGRPRLFAILTFFIFLITIQEYVDSLQSFSGASCDVIETKGNAMNIEFCKEFIEEEGIEYHTFQSSIVGTEEENDIGTIVVPYQYSFLINHHETDCHIILNGVLCNSCNLCSSEEGEDVVTADEIRTTIIKAETDCSNVEYYGGSKGCHPVIEEFPNGRVKLAAKTLSSLDFATLTVHPDDDTSMNENFDTTSYGRSESLAFSDDDQYALIKFNVIFKDVTNGVMIYPRIGTAWLEVTAVDHIESMTVYYINRAKNNETEDDYYDDWLEDTATYEENYSTNSAFYNHSLMERIDNRPRTNISPNEKVYFDVSTIVQKYSTDVYNFHIQTETADKVYNIYSKEAGLENSPKLYMSLI